jgi:hypothetical protein
MPADWFERVWTTSVRDAAVPHLVGPLTSTDEQLFGHYRTWPSWVLGQRLEPVLAGLLLRGRHTHDELVQWARIAGLALWGRELEQPIDIYGCTQERRD